jgi:predicted enzyme related to lactoylglutathione lyase
MGPCSLAVFPYDRDNATGGCLMTGPGLKPSANGAIVYLNAGPSLDATLARIEPAGGAIALPRTELPPGMGAFAQILDTEGNRVGLHAYA